MINKILIFTATYNEVKNIKIFLDLVKSLNIKLDVLVVDDNSPDGTSNVIEDYKQKNNISVKLITRAKKEGLDTAHKLAYRIAKKEKYDYLITLDADLSHDPLKIKIFLNELQNNSFVIGSRYMEGGKSDLKGFRLLLSYYGNKFIKTVFKMKCTEFTSSYRGFNLIKLKDFDLDIVSSKGYSFFMETVYQINKKGIKIKQVPIHFSERKKGVSKIPRIEILRTMFNVLKLAIKNNE